jgi:hypothetical protein
VPVLQVKPVEFPHPRYRSWLLGGAGVCF